MKLQEIDDYKGQPSWRIETETAVYIYHKNGAGFASLIDGDGNDWISFEPSGGSDGRYRGIPNIIHPEGGFHPGTENCDSRIEEDTGGYVITSRTIDGLWSARWKIEENRADLLLDRIGHTHWFLYEGTPGGYYDENTAVMTDSSGLTRPCSAAWEARLPDPRWLFFSVPDSPYHLLLADRTERSADVLDSFWSMEQNMTVFGYGRIRDSSSDRWMHLRKVPSAFAVALVEADGIQNALEQVNDLLHSSVNWNA